MPTIYERIAVCSDTTWNALDAAEQAGYDRHFNTWTGWLKHPWVSVDSLQLGHYEVVVWDDFGVLPRYVCTSANYIVGDENNHVVYRAHESARNNGVLGAGIKMHGVHSAYLDWVTFDGFEFDQSIYSDPEDSYFINCASTNYFLFENCIFSNLRSLYYTLNPGYYKNCLFYKPRGYMRNIEGSTLLLNCGFYIEVELPTVVYNGECYNCWIYSTQSGSGPQFGTACTGNNNYAQDGSGPTAPRALASFGFTDAANGDFSITSASPLYDRGVTTGNETSIDIAGNPRTQGDRIDIGPFERVVQTTLTLNDVVIGSAVSVVDMDNGGFIVAPFVADETTEVMEFSLAVNTNVSVRVRNASGTTKYLPWKSDFLLTPAGATLYVNQLEDSIA